MNKITPFLWFDDNAEDAANFYLATFANSRRLGGLAPGGKVVTIAIELEGQEITFLNGGPFHKLNPSISLVVVCEDQQEIDAYWAKLVDGGKEMACGWLTDKFGLCWQIVPAGLVEMLKHPAAMQAMMAMKKFDIAALQAAAAS